MKHFVKELLINSKPCRGLPFEAGQGARSAVYLTYMSDEQRRPASKGKPPVGLPPILRHAALLAPHVQSAHFVARALPGTKCGATAGLGIDQKLLAGARLLSALMLSACTAPALHYYGSVPAHAAPVQPAAADATAANPVPAKGDPEQRFQVALKLMKDHQPQEAREAFAGLAQDFPQYSGPLNDLGVLQAQGRQRDQAIASFARAIAANGSNAFAYGWLGILYRESGDYAHAEQAYRKAIELKPEDAAAHLNLGILYEIYLKRPAEALAQYREYQRIAGQKNLMVGIWIRQLESKMQPTSVATAETAAGAMP